MSLSNINISPPTNGSGNLYYLNSLNFGTPNIDENYKLTDSIEFTVLNEANEENSIQYNTPIFFTDCSNPITLKYVNQTVKENFRVTSNEPIFFDGRLLKTANISIDELLVNISFSVNIEANDNNQFSYNLSFPLSLENENSSIYDGNILVEKTYENCKFFKND